MSDQHVMLTLTVTGSPPVHCSTLLPGTPLNGWGELKKTLVSMLGCVSHCGIEDEDVTQRTIVDIGHIITSYIRWSGAGKSQGEWILDIIVMDCVVS